MLEQFYKTWELALESRIPTATKRDITGKVLSQTSNFTFRGVEIQMISKLGSNNEYSAVLFVPSTKKFIPNETFVSRSKCAIEILMAITPGEQFEQTRKLREERRRMKLTSNIVEERKKLLASTTFPQEFQTHLLKEFGSQMQGGRLSWDDLFLNIIKHEHGEFTLERTNKPRDIELAWCETPREKMLALNCLYGDIVIALSTTRPDKYGNSVVPYDFVGKYINKNTIGWSKSRAHARNTLWSLLEAAGSTCKFVHCLQYLVVYYEMVTGISPDAKLAEEKARKNYAITSKLRGKRPKRGEGYSIFNGTSTVVAPTTVSTIGDACPALDDFVEEIKQKKVVRKEIAKTPPVEEIVEEPVEEPVKPTTPKKKAIKKKTTATKTVAKAKKTPVTKPKKVVKSKPANDVAVDDLAAAMMNNQV